MRKYYESSNEGTLSGYPYTSDASLEHLAILSTSLLPKTWQYLSKTILPIIDATFIELFGDYDSFQKMNSSFNMQNLESMMVTLQINVPSLKNSNVSDEDELSDKNFILQKLSKIPKLTLTNQMIRFNKVTGQFNISFNVAIGQL